jgi:hypothetical protein
LFWELFFLFEDIHKNMTILRRHAAQGSRLGQILIGNNRRQPASRLSSSTRFASFSTLPTANNSSLMEESALLQRQQHNTALRYFSKTQPLLQASSPFSVAGTGDGATKSPRSKRKKSKFIPRKAAVKLTEKTRTFFKTLLESNPDKDGIMLNFQQPMSGEPRMVFSFGFVTKDELSEEDEG